MTEVKKIKGEQYDELLAFLNEAFDIKTKNDFSVKLPAMWRRTDEVMGKNYAIWDNGKIVAAMGTYPLEFNVAGEKLIFATTGNVAVKKEYREKGLMKLLMAETENELKRLNVDVARLGGQRQRYDRYGYEHGGRELTYTLMRKNIENGLWGKGSNYKAGITFKKIEKTDTKELDAIKKIQESSICYVDRRNAEDFYDIMSAWGHTPYVAICNGEIVGAISVAENQLDIAETYGKTEKLKFDILCAWVMENNLNGCSFDAPFYEKEFCRLCNTYCEYMNEGFSTQIKVLNYEKLLNATIKLRGKTEAGFSETSGSIVVKIEDYGSLEISSKGCKFTDKKQDITVNKLLADVLLFGYKKPDEIIEIPKGKEGIFNAILPLPFWWNGQDRV